MANSSKHLTRAGAIALTPADGEVSTKTFGDWWRLVKVAASAWVADYAPSMGAALSYYSAFSLAPLQLIVISTAGLVFGEDAVRGELFGQLAGVLGSDAAAAV